MENSIIAITQARTTSTRLPRKVLKTIQGTSLLEIHINRILKSKLIDKLIIATTVNREDDLIVDFARKKKIAFYRGSENDVLDRFYQSVKNENPKWIIRITSDCPLIDASLIDTVISKAQDEDLDYCSNTLIESFPDGQDVEVFKFSALEKAWKTTKLSSDREHVTPFIKNNSSFKGGAIFKSDNYLSENNYFNVRLTVDEQQDLEVITYLVKKLGVNATWLDYTTEYLSSEISKLNVNIERNAGYKKSLKNDKNEKK